MGCPNPMQPELENDLQNHINISHNLFNTILATVRNREELERSWLAISRDIDLADAQEQRRMHRGGRDF
jgi:hypothetical protein